MEACPCAAIRWLPGEVLADVKPFAPMWVQIAPRIEL
jgi:hypothetical protein